MHAKVLGSLRPENIGMHHEFLKFTGNAGLHHKLLKFLRLLRLRTVGTWVCGEVLEISEICDAGQHFLVSGSQNIGLHHGFLEFL